MVSSMLFNQLLRLKELRLVPGRHDVAFIELEDDGHKEKMMGKWELPGMPHKDLRSQAVKITCAKKRHVG